MIAALVAAALAAGPGTQTRAVVPLRPGPQRLEVDAALVGASARGDLSDLRLRSAAGAEVPYLLVPPSAPAGAWVRGRVLAVPATKEESGVEADLGGVRTVSRARLSGLPEPFLKRFRLEGSGDRRRWTVLVAEGTLFALPEEGLRQLEAAFQPGAYRYLRVVWDDRASARPPLPAAFEAYEAARSEEPAAPVSAPLAISSRTGEPGVSRFGLILPGPHLPVRAIVLEVGGGHVRRAATVTESRLGAERLEPAVLGEAELRRVVQDGLSAGALRIPLARPQDVELELRVEDGDNPPLDLRGAAAELEPLPWIYFDSPDAAPLVASVGDSSRTAPRYDLEAIRPTLDRVRTSPASLGPGAPAVEPARELALAPDLAPGAPIDRAAFRFAREIPAAAPGLVALRLDAAVLARSEGLADLRVASPDGRQVPYLLEERPEPLEVPLPAPTPARQVRLDRPGVSLHGLDLPERKLPASRLVLDTSSRVFERSVTVYADEAHDGERGPRLVASAAWRHADPARPAPPLSIVLPPLRTGRLLVAVDDGDNAPLRIASARLLLPAWRLRFFHPGPVLSLVYGASKHVAAPRYDLALLAPRLRGAPARELALATAPAARDADQDPGRSSRAFLLALAAAVIVLLGMLVRLFRRVPLT